MGAHIKVMGKAEGRRRRRMSEALQCPFTCAHLQCTPAISHLQCMFSMYLRHGPFTIALLPVPVVSALVPLLNYHVPVAMAHYAGASNAMCLCHVPSPCAIATCLCHAPLSCAVAMCLCHVPLPCAFAMCRCRVPLPCAVAVCLFASVLLPVLICQYPFVVCFYHVPSPVPLPVPIPCLFPCAHVPTYPCHVPAAILPEAFCQRLFDMCPCPCAIAVAHSACIVSKRVNGK